MLNIVNDNDILKDWLDFREDTISSLDSEQDMKHWIYFEEIADKILKSIPKQNRNYVQKQLNILDDNLRLLSNSICVAMYAFTGSE